MLTRSLLPARPVCRTECVLHGKGDAHHMRSGRHVLSRGDGCLVSAAFIRNRVGGTGAARGPDRAPGGMASPIHPPFPPYRRGDTGMRPSPHPTNRGRNHYNQPPTTHPQVSRRREGLSEPTFFGSI